MIANALNLLDEHAHYTTHSERDFSTALLFVPQKKQPTHQVAFAFHCNYCMYI